MPRTPEERAATDRFARTYALGQSRVMRDIERAVCGCDYGGTSWTTREEAETVLSILELEPGRRLLEIGAGAGWPGLYLARRAGCDVALTDLPLEGLRIAGARATGEGLAGVCAIALADGAALPFRDGWFDAVYHSDVLCCLLDKEAVLRACRRALRADGRMAFSVILLAAGLSAADRARAAAAGPPFVEAPRPYEELLRRDGWRITESRDLTSAWLDAAAKTLACYEASAGELAELCGPQDADALLARSRARRGAIEGGLLRRVLITAVPGRH